MIMYLWRKIQTDGLKRDGVLVYGRGNTKNVLIAKLPTTNTKLLAIVKNVINHTQTILTLLANIVAPINGKNKRKHITSELDWKPSNITAKEKLSVIVAEKKTIDFYPLTILTEVVVHICALLRVIKSANGYVSTAIRKASKSYAIIAICRKEYTAYALTNFN